MHRHVRPELPGDPPGHRLDLLAGVVDPRDQQVGDLEPDAGLVLEVPQRVQHRVQLAEAHTVVEVAGEPLEVHVRRVDVPVELRPRGG